MKHRIMFITWGDYNWGVQKGVVERIKERDENGFFERVVNVYIGAETSKVVHLDDISVIHDFGLDLIPGSAGKRWLQILQSPLYFILTFIRIVILAKREKVEIIRAVEPYWCGLLGWLAGKLTGVPFCVSVHADFDKIYEAKRAGMAYTVLGSRKAGLLLERFVLSKTPVVMPISGYLAGIMRKKGVPQNKIRVIPHGIDMRVFREPPQRDISRDFKIEENKKIISFVARLSMEKYPLDALKAVMALSRTRKDFVFIMGGAGPEEKNMKKFVDENDMKDFVIFTGHLHNTVVIDLYKQSLVCLSLLAGFGLIEACAAGLPVVAYDMEWHSELIENNRTGFLIKEGDINGVATAINYLLDHPVEAEEMGQRARALAFERHDIAKTSAIKIRWYEELLSK